MPKRKKCSECKLRKGQRQNNGAEGTLNWVPGNLGLCPAGSCMTLDKWLKPVFVKLEHNYSESSGGLVKTLDPTPELTCRLLGPMPRVSGSLGIVWSLQICISNRFPGEADASGPRTTPLDPLGLLISISIK